MSCFGRRLFQGKNRRIFVLIAFLVFVTLAPRCFRAGEGPSMEFVIARATLQGRLQPDWPVAFNTNEAGRWLLQDGFGFSEPEGTWMTGEVATLRFRAPEGVSPVAIELEVFPFVPSGLQSRLIRVSSSIDDRAVPIYRDGETLELALDGSQDQVIGIECDSASSPTVSGDATDLRTLCVKLTRASIRND